MSKIDEQNKMGNMKKLNRLCIVFFIHYINNQFILNSFILLKLKVNYWDQSMSDVRRRVSSTIFFKLQLFLYH